MMGCGDWKKQLLQQYILLSSGPTGCNKITSRKILFLFWGLRLHLKPPVMFYSSFYFRNKSKLSAWLNLSLPSTHIEAFFHQIVNCIFEEKSESALQYSFVILNGILLYTANSVYLYLRKVTIYPNFRRISIWLEIVFCKKQWLLIRSK